MKLKPPSSSKEKTCLTNTTQQNCAYKCEYIGLKQEGYEKQDRQRARYGHAKVFFLFLRLCARREKNKKQKEEREGVGDSGCAGRSQL